MFMVGVVRLVSDPVVRKAGESDVCNFRCVWDSGFGDAKKGVFFGAACFGKRARTLAEYVSNKDLVVVVATMSEREYVDDGGNERISNELRIIDFSFLPNGEKKEGGGKHWDGNKPVGKKKPKARRPSTKKEEVDDDIPF